MARQQPVPAEGVRDHALTGPTTSTMQQAKQPVQRIAGVRIIRGGWSGVSLRLANGTDTGSLLQSDLMELALVMADGRSVRIATIDSDEAVAVWRGASHATGLPMMIETADGAVQAPFPQIGRLALGPIRIRRSHGATASRRPRFLRRRKTAKLADLPKIVNGVVLSDR
ncbi:MAG: DUF6101 family protein [Bosea sp. (in: a-proteobacteria)]